MAIQKSPFAVQEPVLFIAPEKHPALCCRIGSLSSPFTATATSEVREDIQRLLELEDQLRGWLPQSQKAVEQLKALEPGAASLAKYLYGRGGGFPVYQNTAMTYFPGGEAKFE